MTHSVHVSARGAKRLKSGHPWVFANEIKESVRDLPAGGTVDVHAPTGGFIGRGYANAKSLIAIRLLTRSKRQDIDDAQFYIAKLRSALSYRERVYPDRQSLRLVHAEGDGLPGLVIDRYGDALAVQLTTLGMECRKEVLQEALNVVFKPSGAVLRNDSAVRKLEGLPLERTDWFGDVPESVDVDEFGVKFRIALHAGQKTGHFFDQADNRRFAGSLCKGGRVLDVYANTGGWALHALHNGAKEAIVVDKSESTCGLAAANADLNGFGEQMQVINDEGKKTLQYIVSAGERFDAVVLDPPAFAKTKKVVQSALRGYTEINALGLTLVRPGGFFFPSSCSYHVSEEDYLRTVHTAALEVGRTLRIVRRGQQSADHPVVPGIPETRYLKSFAIHVTT